MLAASAALPAAFAASAALSAPFAASTILSAVFASFAVSAISPTTGIAPTALSPAER
jgi:hypothetical protein